MDIDAHVGKKIQERRKSLKYSQEEIASAVGLTRTSIVNIEAGRQKISIDALLKICAILRCKVMDILPPIPIVTTKRIKEEQTQVKVITINKLKSEFEWPNQATPNNIGGAIE